MNKTFRNKFLLKKIKNIVNLNAKYIINNENVNFFYLYYLLQPNFL